MNNNEKNDYIINNIKTSMKMENQFLSSTDINILKDYMDNKISMEDAMTVFKNMTL